MSTIKTYETEIEISYCGANYSVKLEVDYCYYAGTPAFDLVIGGTDLCPASDPTVEIVAYRMYDYGAAKMVGAWEFFSMLPSDALVAIEEEILLGEVE